MEEKVSEDLSKHGTLFITLDTTEIQTPVAEECINIQQNSTERKARGDEYRIEDASYSGREGKANILGCGAP